MPLLALYTATIFLGALLLFLIQPMFAKMALPLLGGPPQVWAICMVFFQAVLLLGYGYAHWSTRWLGTMRQALVHAAVLALPTPAEVGEAQTFGRLVAVGIEDTDDAPMLILEPASD